LKIPNTSFKKRIHLTQTQQNEEAKLEQLERIVQREGFSGSPPAGFEATVVVNEATKRIDHGHLVIASPPELVWAMITTYAKLLETSPSDEELERMVRAMIIFQ